MYTLYLTIFSFFQKALDIVGGGEKWGVMLGDKDNYNRSFLHKGFWGTSELSAWRLRAELISYKV